MTTALAEQKIKPTSHDRSHDNQISAEQKMEAVLSVARLIEKGLRSTSTIMEHLGPFFPRGTVSDRTAIKYRNAAMAVLHEENKPLNREHIRNLEIGRYTYWIDRLTRERETFINDGGTKDARYYQALDKMTTTLNKYGERLHAITGLNEITINNGETQRRIVFTYASPQDIAKVNQPSEVIEGTVVEADHVPTA